jgi:hypothetical protein
MAPKMNVLRKGAAQRLGKKAAGVKLDRKAICATTAPKMNGLRKGVVQWLGKKAANLKRGKKASALLKGSKGNMVKMTLTPVQSSGDNAGGRDKSHGRGGKPLQLSLAAPGAHDIPRHWSEDGRCGRFPAQGWRLQLVENRNERWALSKCLRTEERFGGCDNKEGDGRHTSLKFKFAWHIESPALWGKYHNAKEQIRSDFRLLQNRSKRLQIRSDFFRATRGLPIDLDFSINESLLLHGSTPDVILSIIQNGMNEHYSGNGAGTAFGDGLYFCEDAAKADQYVQIDKRFKEDSELHKRLFTTSHIRHPGNLCYMFLERVAMGAFAMTKDGETLQYGCVGKPGGAVFANEAKRELANIPETNPPVLYHGLLVNKGEHHERFKEFVQFHGDRCYPEYLIAYQRC